MEALARRLGERTPSYGAPDTDEEAQLAAALALAAVPHLGPAGARRLVDLYGSPAEVLARARGPGGVEARPDPAHPPLHPKAVSRLATVRPAPTSRLRDLAAAGIRLVRYGGRGYPAGLLDLHHPPVVLYLTGSRSLPEDRAVALVGTRRATEYGRRLARDLARDLAIRGWWIVSGMARGIDGAAHRAALEAGGESAGILAGGVDIEYPAVHRRLFGAMRRNGVLASEFPPGTPPDAGLFPRRNRIIAALARAVIVVQAGRRSGALITAAHGLELGREVGAVPGPVGPEASVGVHELLRDGAAVVTRAEDVLELVAAPPAAGRRESGSGPGDDPDGPAALGRLPAQLRGPSARAWHALAEGPARADRLAAATGLPLGPARELLDLMELEGLLGALPGDRYERAAPSGA